MTYPHVTQFQTIDNRRRQALASVEAAPRPARSRRSRLHFRRRPVAPCSS